MKGDDDDGNLVSTSLAPPRVLDYCATAAPSQGMHAEAMLLAHNRSLKALALLSLGLLKDKGSPVFNPSILTWSAAQKASTLKFTSTELKAEVEQRCNKSCIANFTPQNVHGPRAWKNTKLMEWLIKKPDH